MRYNGINTYDDVNVLSGIGVSLFVQGCLHRCEGCHNRGTWDYWDGVKFDEEAENKLLKVLDTPYVGTFSVLGGEPMMEFNRDTVLNVVRKVKVFFPEKTTMMWTGYELPELLSMGVDLKDFDYIVDGKYEKDVPSTNRLYGSGNQKLWKQELGRWRVIG